MTCKICSESSNYIDSGLPVRGVFAPAFFKPELLRKRHPRPQHCVAALHAVGFELPTNGCQLMSGDHHESCQARSTRR